MARTLNIGVRLPSELLNEVGATGERPRMSKSYKSIQPVRKEQRKAARIEKRAQKLHNPTSNGFKNYHKRKSAQNSLSSQQDLHSAPAIPPRAPKIMALGSRRLTEPGLGRSNSQEELFADRDVSVKNTSLKRGKVNSTNRTIVDKLAEDDAKIEALERALGIEGKVSLPKAFRDDGLDEILDGFGGSGVQQQPALKKRQFLPEERAWLQEKRQKASSQAYQVPKIDRGVPNDTQLLSEKDQLTKDEFSSQSSEAAAEEFNGFEDDSNTNTATAFLAKRENPYIAPQQTGPVARYVPPFQRGQSPSDEVPERLRRQIQGTLNRLSEAKLLSIVADIENVYRNHPRHQVSAILLNALYALVCDPSPLQDTFLILHGGFVAAIYKIMGTEFGAHIIQKFVQEFDILCSQKAQERSLGKRLSNLIGFLAELYTFQVTSSVLIYDFIRKFIYDLSEDNAELLLRLTRISGTQLRQEDPTSLKDIAALLEAQITKVGSENLSVRTRFIIETIENLKNNRTKTGIATASLRSERTIAMKKILGSINRNSIKASEPLRVGLEDIRSSHERGKWWLIGASYQGENGATLNIDAKTISSDEIETRKDIEDLQIPSDLFLLAREQRMNTELRRSIFVIILSSSDFKEAHTRLLRLKVKKALEVEIPNVIIHCARAERVYNPYYTLISKKLCAERKYRIGFQFSLRDLLRRLEDEDEVSGGDEVDRVDTQAIVNVAKLYGTLILEDSLTILLLKSLDFTYLHARTSAFVELIFITIFLQMGSSGHESGARIKAIFDAAQSAPGMIGGLHLFLDRIVKKTDILGSIEEKALVTRGCNAAEDVLTMLLGRNMANIQKEVSE